MPSMLRATAGAPSPAALTRSLHSSVIGASPPASSSIRPAAALARSSGVWKAQAAPASSASPRSASM